MAHLRNRTIVITGATSGIGRASALEFARRGAAVVVTARREGELDALAAECRAEGGRALPVPGDVTDAAALAEVAKRAVEEFGGIDVWVNNAAVVAYGRTEEMPDGIWRRVVEVNLFGAYHGARAALPHFRERGRGVLINVSSMLGKTPSPYQSAYVVSKYGMRALGECLRQELTDADGIHVATVLPGPIDTPLFRSGANLTGHQVMPPGPPIDARRVAGAIVRCARRPRPEVAVGASTRVGLAATRVAPRLTAKVFGGMVERTHFTDEPAARTEGNLFIPDGAAAGIDGGWRRGRTGTRKALALGAGVIAVGAGVAVARAIRERR